MNDRWEDLLYVAAGTLVIMAVLAVVIAIFAVALFISNWRKVREDMDENFRRRIRRDDDGDNVRW